MPDPKKTEHLLETLRSRIFTPVGIEIGLKWKQAQPGQRTEMAAGPGPDWDEVSPSTIWGEPQSYFWFGGAATIPETLAGKRIYLEIDAQFGRVMGRSDPQCLVRINGEIVQGADYNHKEVLLTAAAEAGERFEILIEAGTVEDRRQIGFACRLLVHDPDLEALYYDLRVPLDVALRLPETDHRRDFILTHAYDALNMIDARPGHPTRFAKSVAAARAHANRIYEAVDTDLAPHITVTGHTHIDVAWLWRIRETRQKMARSMATALHLMQDYPEYRFMYNQGVLLDYLDQDYPELFARIKERQKSGQFEIEGALWLEPDANMTGGESLVRHILRGVRYHQETFNVRPTVLWLPDTFGYSAALPQIMELSELTVFVTHKMSWNDTNRMPSETFFWQGVDGSKVPTYFLTTQPMESTSIGTTYCPDLKATHVMGAWRRYAQKQVNDELFLVYGFGDGGGGPTREMLEHIRRMQRGIPGCPRVEQGTMGPFFERLVGRMHDRPGRFPTWVGELYLEFHRGTFTSVAKVKRNNRRAEATLRELEALASFCQLRAAMDYPATEIAALWDIALLNQFHDILPGSSIGPVFEDSDRDYAEFFTRAEALHKTLAGGLAGAGETFVFNPLGQARGGLVEIETSGPVTLSGQPSQTLFHADGTCAEAAPIAPVPALGGARVVVAPGPAAALAGELQVSPTLLENTLIRAQFDANGRLTSVFDKLGSREVLRDNGPGNRLQAYRDLPAQYDAWDIDQTFEDQVWEIDELENVEVVETGPYRAAIKMVWRYESSRVVQIVSLEAGAALLTFDTFIDWHEKNTLVKAAFELALNTSEARAEIQFGHVTRPTHANTSWDQARFECPMQRWVDLSEPGLSGAGLGVAFLNDCKYGYDAKGSTLRLTLLRSPTYPWADADQGAHQFRYGLLVHHGLEADQVPAAAEAFNHPLTMVEGAGPGKSIDLSSLVMPDNPAIAVEALKRAEDGQGWIVRLWERHGAQQTTMLGLAPEISGVAETNLLEENPRNQAIIGGSVSLQFGPFEIKTLRLDVGPIGVV